MKSYYNDKINELINISQQQNNKINELTNIIQEQNKKIDWQAKRKNKQIRKNWK